ncbi:MAG: hypothetical protein M3N46_14120 [Actinomycetota bacterium]|nr:hypothetical protein [Actinomycetota bacterium]
MPARFASWNDILANTTGTVVGVAIAVIAREVSLSFARRATSAAR